MKHVAVLEFLSLTEDLAQGTLGLPIQHVSVKAEGMCIKHKMGSFERG